MPTDHFGMFNPHSSLSSTTSVSVNAVHEPVRQVASIMETHTAQAANFAAFKVLHHHRQPQETRKLAEANLRALLLDLSSAQRILLEALKIKFVFTNIEGESAGSDYSALTLELDIEEFSCFTYQNKSVPIPDQRWALSTLKEVALHFLASHFDFDTSREWTEAAARELKTRNEAFKELCQEQRQYDSSSTDEKLSLDEYAADAPKGLLQKARFNLTIQQELCEQLLVDVLLVRDYLVAIAETTTQIHEKMQAAFPNTYPLVLKFERLLEEQAALHASKH